MIKEMVNLSVMLLFRISSFVRRYSNDGLAGVGSAGWCAVPFKMGMDMEQFRLLCASGEEDIAMGTTCFHVARMERSWALF